MYTDKLHNIFDKSNNKYCRTIKMKSIDVKISTPTDFDVENNDKDNNFQVVNLVRASKHEKNLRKVTFLEVFLKQFTKNNCTPQMKQSLGMKR